MKVTTTNVNFLNERGRCSFGYAAWMLTVGGRGSAAGAALDANREGEFRARLAAISIRSADEAAAEHAASRVVRRIRRAASKARRQEAARALREASRCKRCGWTAASHANGIGCPPTDREIGRDWELEGEPV